MFDYTYVLCWMQCGILSTMGTTNNHCFESHANHRKHKLQGKPVKQFPRKSLSGNLPQKTIKP